MEEEDHEAEVFAVVVLFEETRVFGKDVADLRSANARVGYQKLVRNKEVGFFGRDAIFGGNSDKLVFAEDSRELDLG